MGLLSQRYQRRRRPHVRLGTVARVSTAVGGAPAVAAAGDAAIAVV